MIKKTHTLPGFFLPSFAPRWGNLFNGTVEVEEEEEEEGLAVEGITVRIGSH